MSRIIVGIQARMGSQRLPGKVLMDLCGKPLIRRVWDAVDGPWERIILTSLKEENDIFCSYLDDAGMAYRRGSELDVLSRYTSLYVDEPHDTILVRVCADAPFIKAEWIKRAVEENLLFVPNVLHLGTRTEWLLTNKYLPAEREHAASFTFERWARQSGRIAEMAPANYLMVNTQADLDEARRRWQETPSAEKS